MQQIAHKVMQGAIVLLLQKIPVNLSILTPLPELSEVLSHEKKLLSGVPHHEEIARFQIPEFLFLHSRHFLNHRALQMHHFIMRKHKNKLLRISIAHTEGHLVVMVGTINGILLHIGQKIMHPPHIPLEMKAQSALFRRLRNVRPRSRLFRDNDGSVFSFSNDGVQMFKKLNGLKIPVSSVLIGNPLSVFPAIIQVEHRRHRIHPKSVNMIKIIPVQSIRNQKVLYFRFSIIKNLCSPVRMFPEPRIRVFITRFPVELTQSVTVFRKMSRYPIQNHADAGLMQNIYHFHKSLRTAMSGGRRIVSRHLISPGTVKRMLQNAHQFYMRVSHVVAVLCEVPSCLLVSDKSVSIRISFSLPGTKMHLINRHGALVPIPLTLLHPLLILPGKSGKVFCNRRRAGAILTGKSVGVRLINPLVASRQNSVLIKLSHSHIRYKKLINPRPF